MVNDYAGRTDVTGIVKVQIIKRGSKGKQNPLGTHHTTSISDLQFCTHYYNLRKWITLSVSKLDCNYHIW